MVNNAIEYIPTLTVYEALEPLIKTKCLIKRIFVPTQFDPITTIKIIEAVKEEVK